MEVSYDVDSDDLAVFAGSPCTHFQQDDEAWENLDPLLNQVVGYVATPETISQRIQQGKFGMDGTYTWLAAESVHWGAKIARDLFPFLEGRGGGEGLQGLIQIKGPRVLDFFFAYPLPFSFVIILQKEQVQMTLWKISKLLDMQQPLHHQLSRVNKDRYLGNGKQ